MQYQFNSYQRDVLVRIVQDYIRQRNEELEAITEAIRTAQFIEDELTNPFPNQEDHA